MNRINPRAKGAVQEEVEAEVRWLRNETVNPCARRPPACGTASSSQRVWDRLESEALDDRSNFEQCNAGAPSMNPTMSAPEFGFAGASPATAKLDGRSVIESLKLTLLIDRSTGAVEEKQAIALHRDPLGSGRLRKGFAFHSNRTAKAHGRAPARHASAGPGSAADLQVNSPQTPAGPAAAAGRSCRESKCRAASAAAA